MEKAMKPILMVLAAAALSACAGVSVPGSSEESISSTGGAQETSSVSSAVSEEASSSQAVESSSSPIDDGKVSDLKQAFEKIAKARNYTITVTCYVGASVSVNHDFYAGGYFYDDYEGDEYGYAIANNSLVRIDAYEDSFVSSPAIKDAEGKDYSSIWDYEDLPNLIFPEAAYSSGEGKKSMSIKNKKAKLQFLSFLQINNSEYSSLTELSAKLEGDTLAGFSILGNFGGEAIYSCEFSEFGTTEVPSVEAFLDRAEPYQAPAALTWAKDALRTNNFSHPLYQDLTGNFLTQTEEGREYYMPQYWYVNYLTASVGHISSGYLSLHNKALASEDYQVKYDGAYYFTMNDEMSRVTSMLVGPNGEPSFVTHTYNMVDIMDYPSKFIGLDSPQFFAATENNDYPGSESFVTTKNSLMLDFARISQIANNFDENAAIYAHSLEIVVYPGDNAESKEDDAVIFLFTISVNDVGYKCEYVYTDFGASDIPAVDSFLAQFEDYNVA